MKEKDKEASQLSLFFIQRFKGKVLFGVPMSAHTALGIGGNADVMAFPQDEADLKDIIVFAEAKGFPCHILGAGTNLLVRDGGVRGIVVNMTEGFKDVAYPEETRMIAGAGLPLVKVLSDCREKGLAGLEFAANIPGTIGGAVVMNAGAYGGEMKDIVEGIEVVGKKGQKKYIAAADLNFAYRSADVPKNTVIIRAHLKFKKCDPSAVQEKIKTFRERRGNTAAITRPNAGSIFKNPPNGFAGRLIEEAGFKGERAGDAEVSAAHANYIVNRGNARAKDVLSLMGAIRDRVYGSTGILLEPEIRVIGEDL